MVVLGRLAQKENTGDRGSSQVYPPYVVTAVKGIAAASPKTEVIYYEGSNPEHSRHLPRRPTRSYLLLVMIITTKASMWLRTERMSTPAQWAATEETDWPSRRGPEID